MTELPKVMGFAELKGESWYYGAYDRAEAAPTWRDRLAKWVWPEGLRALFDVQAENRRLRVKLLEAVRACEDAGRIGLQLYDENEKLNQLVRLTNATPEQVSLMSKSVLDQSKEIGILQDKLKRAYEDHQRLHDQVYEWIAQFGEPK
jgi:hypothetical protein